MLVEDDNNLREIYQARLNSEGYETVTASDGEEALSIVGKEKPDLIILDVMMPKISGFDTLDLLKNSPVTKDIKVIMMTALSQAEDRARAQKLGAQNYLVKSQVTLEDIVKAIKDALDGTSVYPNSDAPTTTDSTTPTPSVFSTSTSVDEPATSPVAAPAPAIPQTPETPATDAPAPAGVSIEHVDEPANDPVAPSNDQPSPMPEITLPDASSTDSPTPPSDSMPMESPETPATDAPAPAGVSIEHVDEPATTIEPMTPPTETPVTPTEPTDSNPTI